MNSIPLPDFEVSLSRVIFSALLLFCFGYDWIHVARDYWRDTDRRSDRSSLRALLKSSVLVAIILVVLTGAINAAWFAGDPMVRETLRTVGGILTGAALPVGIALVWSWRADKREVRRR